MRHHGYKQVREDHLVLDQAGGSWWIWDPRGEVLVAGKPTKDAAVIALAAGDTEDEDVEPKTAAELDRDIAEELATRQS